MTFFGQLIIKFEIKTIKLQMLSYHKNVNAARKKRTSVEILFGKKTHPMGFEPIVQASEACVVSIPL